MNTHLAWLPLQAGARDGSLTLQHRRCPCQNRVEEERVGFEMQGDGEALSGLILAELQLHTSNTIQCVCYSQYIGFITPKISNFYIKINNL